MPLGKIVFIIVFGVFAAAPGFYWYVLRSRLRDRPRRLLRRRKSTAIAALKEGEEAKITGVVAAREDLLRSPIGGHACIGFQTSIDHRPSGSAGEVWLSIWGRTACSSFSVTDETGTAVVEGPFSLELDVDDGAWSDMPPAVFQLLEEAYAQYFLRTSGDARMRFQEALLKSGDRVSVLGHTTIKLDPAARGSYREPPMLPHIGGTAIEPVRIIDEDEPVGAS